VARTAGAVVRCMPSSRSCCGGGRGARAVVAGGAPEAPVASEVAARRPR
jgi:hypothetical protein